MNELRVFENPAFGQVRTIEINDEPWFVGKDVAEALGYTKPRNAIADHVDEGDARKQGVTDSLGRIQEMTVINESGIYSLILSSNLPTAKEFKRWITSEVIPSIRKTGAYTNRNDANQSDADMLIKCAEIMATCEASNRPYVLNILRGIVPDIDSTQPNVEDYSHQNNLQPDSACEHSPERCRISRAGYSVPFDNLALGRKLKEKNMSAYELAAIVHCDERNVVRWLRGENRPGAAYRDKICIALNMRRGTLDRIPNRH